MKNKPKNINDSLNFEISSRLDSSTYLGLLSNIDWYIYNSLNPQLYGKIHSKIRYNLSVKLYKYIRNIF